MSHKVISPLIILSLLLLQINVASACSPSLLPPMKFEAKDLIIKTNLLGPVYTNIDEYTLIHTNKTPSSACGPGKTYIKTSALRIIYILLGVMAVTAVTAIYRNREQRKWSSH
jgi:hypothetical protein